MRIKPEFLKKNGKPEFVILRYGDYLKLQELAEDMQDLKALRASKAKQAGSKRISLADLKRSMKAAAGK